jgi:hypothetical protein
MVIESRKSHDTIHLTLVRDGNILAVAAELRARRPHLLW